MRNPAEMLALLSPHGVLIGHIPGGHSGFQALDVAGSLGMAHLDFAGDLLLAKYSLNGSALRAAKARWRMMVGDRCIAEGWSRKKTGAVFALADYSLSEALDPLRCPVCHGAEVVINQVKQSCKACEGVGLRLPSDRAIARGLSLSHTAYRSGPWPERVKWCRGELARIESTALGILAHA